MKLASYEAYLTEDRRAIHESRVPIREETHRSFPHIVVLEGVYPEHDFAQRWAWQNFGPQDGKCQDHYSEYPGCPLVLETKQVVTGSDHQGNAWSENVYKDPGEHSHEGKWKTFWLGKTGYDYGFCEYCFKDEADKDKFFAAWETFGLGEPSTRKARKNWKSSSALRS
jgi:hypothetical protein